MNLILAAKKTKPGSKANSRKKSSSGAPARVPVGTLHYVDTDDQTTSSSMFVAVCGEGELLSLDGLDEDNFDNERCAVCEDKRWAADFNEMQKGLLK